MLGQVSSALHMGNIGVGALMAFSPLVTCHKSLFYLSG